MAVDVLQHYRETGALLEGHFLLKSGLHSPYFLQSAAVFQYPEHARALAGALAEKLRPFSPDFVIGPAIGGVVLSFLVAEALGARAIFAEKDEAGGMFIRPGLVVRPGERFVAVEDVVTTGGSVRRAAQAALARGAELVAVGAVVDRSPTPPEFGVPFLALVRFVPETYTPEACPLCRAGVPLSRV